MNPFLLVKLFGWVIIYKVVSQAPECIQPWDYCNQVNWCCDVDYRCCGLYQSPINIKPKRVIIRPDDCVDFINYEKMPNANTLHNNFYTLEMLYEGKSGEEAHVNYDGQKYNFNRATFHFGSKKKGGSQHTLNGQRFPLEMQMVHVNSKYGNNIEQAKTQPDGLLIVSVFFVLTCHDNKDLRPLIYDMHYAMWRDDVRCIKPFPPKNLMPLNFGGTYSYKGSLPFPPCIESVRYIVMHMPVYISKYQLGQFRKLQRARHINCPKGCCPMYNNNRKLICNHRVTHNYTNYPYYNYTDLNVTYTPACYRRPKC